jgi:aldehyde:ferredoxin oxidoreductase
MPYGYNGKILHVHLDQGRLEVEEPDAVFYRTYWGGSGFAAYYLNTLVKPGTDPLGPDNVLIFACSVLTGAGLPGFNRYTVAAKSPLTGTFGEAEAAGYFGPELKFAGFDAVVFHGRSPKPVYLYVNRGEVALKDASALWGLENAPLRDRLAAELGDDKIRVASIGPAGETLSPLACVINELAHANGRCGLGAVMGSKNVKAVVARGDAEVMSFADPEALKELNTWHRKRLAEHMPNVNLGKFGTPMHLMAQQNAGILPTRNWRESVFEGAEKVGVPGYEKILARRHTCYKCSVACKRVVNNNRMDQRYGGPEYETMAGFGPLCGVDDLDAIVLAHEKCNAYGFDTIGVGGTIAFAMECFENAILTPADAEGRDIRFGDVDGMLWLIEAMKDGRSLGKILRLGSAKAAKIIGKGAEKYVCAIKGQEPGYHDPRGKIGVGLGFALSPTGGDHIEEPHEVAFQGEAVRLVSPMGIVEPPLPGDGGPKKVRYFKAGQLTWGMNNVLGLCNFVVAPLFALTYDKLIAVIKAVTGWETSLYELFLGAERSLTMARMFNVAQGIPASEDKLFSRMHQPIGEGPAKGKFVDETEFKEAVALYYQMMGYDEAGVPLPGKLHELNVGWLVKQ